MNPLTLVKRIQKMNSREADLGISEDASWHAKYKDSAYVFVGGIPYDLTEGDLLAIFAQYGELVDVNLVRDKASGKPKGFAFIAYEDQRSTNLAVDNLNGAQILGRTVRVDHVTKYKKKEEEDEEEEMKKREERGVCRAFQKGECTRGAGCKFSHDEQRAANTGWGHEEDRQSRLGYDKSEDQVTERQKKEERGVCFAFQRGECTRGAGCKFSHDEQRAANTGWGNEEDRRSRLGRDKFEKGSKPERRPVDIPSGRDRESVASARHKANELDAGRSRRREDESYRKPSETDYKDRDGRDKSRQLEVQEKVVHTEERDTRGAGENYGSRGEKRSRRHDTEEDELDAGRSRRREDESYRKPSETDKDRDGRDKSRQLEVQEKVVHKEERDTRGAGENYDSRGEKRSRRHDTEEDELDAGRSRRREDESYRKPSETDYKDRDGRDKSRQLEVQEKVVHKEERDTRGAGENYDSRGEKRSRRHDTEEFHPRENRDDRERDRERQHDKERGKENRSSHARDSSSLRSRDRDDDDDHYRSRR